MTAEEYKELFKELYNSGEPIINNTTQEVFESDPDEVFRQCWADTVQRCKFPPFWFVSNKGNLLSVKKDKIRWLNKNRRENSNKISYKFMVDRKDDEGTQIRNVEEHNLVGIVFESESFGKATQLLEEKGIDSIGVNSSSETHVQGHHISQDDTDNRPTNVKFVTDTVHTLITNAPKYNAPEEKQMAFMKELGEIATEENPNQMTVFMDGSVYDLRTGEWRTDGDVDIFATKKIVLSKTAAKQLLSIIQFLN